ncbi:uncharacterized protein LOC105837497 [Monomorium pharaonis]|uniref:uncharacterized protein LOC105837497 n=1 Tax=Monomorium pharaonis TaxID=307658 RepID=UPI00063F2945|nr:uncharacterized protein LOC105837497 [Monomorium pharaonis]XP_036143559.1 uncharacterized protein LOC105837497 [Monomorium pharaonis]XP_036143560.1 uncharacterized protein LOC105837497 [Monomorium pharaonis]
MEQIGTAFMYPSGNKFLFLEKACVQAESSSNLLVVWNQRATNAESVVSIYFDVNLQRFSMIPADDPDKDLQAMGKDAATIVSASYTINFSGYQFLFYIFISDESSTYVPPKRQQSSTFDFICVIVPPPRPVSAPCNNLYENKKTKRKSTAIMEEAINLIQKTSQPLPPRPQKDDADIFGNLVETHLRGLEQEKRKQCENEILIVLTRY